MADHLAKETKLSPFRLFELRTAVLKFTESEMYEDAAEIDAICSLLQRVIFEDDYLVLFSEKKAEPRREQIKIKFANDQECDKILAMADKYNFSEYECERYWEQAKNAGDREKLSSILGKNFAPRDYETVAKEFYHMECECLLDSILFLFRALKNQGLNDLSRERCLVIAKKLMKRGDSGSRSKGIAMSLMNVLMLFIDTISPQSDSTSRSDERRMLAEGLILRVAESLFYIFSCTDLYSTSERSTRLREYVEHVECVKRLVECINTMSARCNEQYMNYWQYALYSALVVIQLALVRAIRPVDNDIDLWRDQRIQIILMNTFDFDPKKNSVATPWPCRLAQGFCNLAYSLLLEAIDMEEVDLGHLLDRASNLRAFCYTRRCILSLLQCVSLFKAELQLDLMDTLSEFIKSILKMLNSKFQMTGGKHGRSKYWPVCLHPRSKFKTLEEFKRNEGVSAFKGPFEMSDCLDDVLDLAGAVGCAYPSFASEFWKNSEPPLPSKLIFNTTKGHIADDSMLPSLYRFLIGFSGGGRNRVATEGIFYFYRTRLGAENNWDRLFGLIGFAYEDIYKKIADPTKDEHWKEYELLGWVERLNPIMKFISASIQAKDAAEKLSNLDPIQKLFSLLTVAIPADLRGAVFHAIAALVRNSSVYVEIAWNAIEDYRLLPVQVDGQPAERDLRFFLEQTETEMKSYCITDGFLALLSALLKHGVPNGLGYPVRRPGILIYLEFVLEIIRNAPVRPYYEPAEQWRLTARAMQIFRDVLQMYPINDILSKGHSKEYPEDFQKRIAYDFKQESEMKLERYPMGYDRPPIESPCPKTAGFTLMTWLLGDHELIHLIFSVLSECSPLITEKVEFVPDSVKMAYTILSQTGTSKRFGGLVHNAQYGCDLHKDSGDNIDFAYWQQAAVTASIGLLSDCQSREAAFLECVRSAGFVLHITSSSGTRQTMQPVRVFPLSRSLLSHRSVSASPLSLIAQFIQGNQGASCNRGNLSVMSADLLRKTASIENAGQFITALEIDEDGFDNLKRRCIRALQNPEDQDVINIEGEDVSIVCQSADAFFDRTTSLETPIFSKSASKSRSILDAVLNLVAATLFKEKAGISNYLLGFLGGMSPYNPRIPLNCFHAILDLLAASEHSPSIFSLVYTRPSQAKQCFEIIYRLCEDRNTAEDTLGLLGTRSVSFFERQFLSCMSRLQDLNHSLSEAMLEQDEELEENLFTIEKLQNNIADTEQCLAWLLKTAAIQVHVLRFNGAYDLQSNPILKKCFDSTEDPFMMDMQQQITQRFQVSPLIYLLKSIDLMAHNKAETAIISVNQDALEYIKTFTIDLPGTDGRHQAINFLKWRDNSDDIGYDPIQILMSARKYNFFMLRAVAAENVCDAARHFISVCILDVSDFFIGEIRDIIELEREGRNVDRKIEEAKYKVDRILITSLLQPLLDILIENRGASNFAIESLSKALLPVINAVKLASTARIWLSIYNFEVIFTKLLDALLNRGSGSDGFGFLNSSECSRGCIYICLSNMLRYGYGEMLAIHQAEYHMTSIHVLELRPEHLAEILGKDIVSPKSPDAEIWRSSAASLLSLVFATLGPPDKAIPMHVDQTEEDYRLVHGSPAFLRILQVLLVRSRNYLHLMIGTTDLNCTGGAKADILQTMLGLFTNIALNNLGAQQLIDCGLAERLRDMNRFNREEILPRAGGARDDILGSEGAYSLLAVLRLLRALVVQCPTTRAVVSLCTSFMRSNYDVLSSLMHAVVDRRDMSSLTLDLVESSTALASLIASSEEWNIGLGHISVDFVKDTTRLLFAMGMSLFPGSDARGQRRDDNWWGHVKSTSSETQNEGTRPLLIQYLVGSSVPWSTFDNRLLGLGLRTLRHASSTLRLTAANVRVTKVVSLSDVIDFMSTATVFCSITNLLEASLEAEEEQKKQKGKLLQDPNSPSPENHPQPFDLDNEFVRDSILFVIENIICVLYYIVSVWSETDIKQLSDNAIYDHIESVLNHAEKDYFGGSLTRNTARWIREKIDHLPRLKHGRGANGRN